MNWSTPPLKHLLLAAGSGTWGRPPEGSEPAYPVLRSTNIQDGRLQFDSTPLRSVSEKAASEYLLKLGDILVTTSSGSPSLLGKNAIVEELPGHGGKFVFSNFTWRLRPDPKVLVPKYLYYFLNSPRARAELARIQSTTSGLRNLDTKSYLIQPVPLPTLPEQHRIIEILDQADRLRRLRTEADAYTDGVLPAILVRVLGSPANWHTDPRCEPLEELAIPVSGATPSKRVGAFWEGSVPWVSPKDMKVEFLSDSQDHVSEVALQETNLKLIEQGSALVVVRGMILARSVPLAINLSPVTINQDMKALEPRTEEVTGTYLWAALTAAKAQLKNLVRTAGHGTRKLDTPDLMEFRIPRPDPDQLRQVSSVVETHRQLVERRRESELSLKRLFTLLLAKAFDGSLTAAWREAQATALLEDSHGSQIAGPMEGVA